MAEDYSIPRNLTNTLFADIELPEVSRIQKKKPSQQENISPGKSKYLQNDDDDVFNLELGQISKIVPIVKEPTNSNNSNKSTSNSSEGHKSKSKMVIGSKGRKRNTKRKSSKEIPKQQIDIDNEIGEIAEWGQRGAKNNSDEDDFDEAEDVGQTKEQQDIRRKLEQKLRTGNIGQKNKPGGLKAKAEQLRKQKQNEKQPTANSAQLLNQPKKENKNEPFKSQPSSDHETSADLLKTSEKKRQMIMMPQDESEDDPWEKVNQKTVQHMKNIQEKRSQMSVPMVIKFYQEQFQFDQEDIQMDEEAPQKTEEKEKELSCLEKIFSCLQEKPKRQKKVNNNTKLAKRFVAISKKQLTNDQYQFYILESIWNRLSTQAFARYGNHWNMIGFQGRDPGTDLRSTGVLSILQWLLFLQDHPKLGKQYGSWSIDNEYPLALTHIKITGVFLDLVLKSKIKGTNWNQFQNQYNALILGMLKSVKDKFKGGYDIGTLVEEEAKSIKKSYQKQISRYNSEFKK